MQTRPRLLLPLLLLLGCPGVQGSNLQLDHADDGSYGEDEVATFAGTLDVDDSGTYEVVITAAHGYDCATPIWFIIGASYP